MFLSTLQVAEKLQISKDRVIKLAESGVLPHLPLLDDNAKRKYYKFDEQAVYAYRRSLKQAAAPAAVLPPTKAASIETPPAGFLSLTDAADRLGIKRQALYDYLTNHSGDFDKVKIGRMLYVSAESIDREHARRSVVRVPAAIAAIVNNNGNRAETPAVAAPHGITSILERIERRQTALEHQIADVAAAIEQLLKAWS
jgi:hypothetical protein